MKQGVDYDALRAEKMKKAKMLGVLFSIQVLLDLAIVFIISKMVIEKITGV